MGRETDRYREIEEGEVGWKLFMDDACKDPFLLGVL